MSLFSFLFLSLLSSCFYCSNHYLLCFFLSSGFLLIFSSHYSSFLLCSSFFSDELSLFMGFMLLCVIFSSFFWVLRFHYSSFLGPLLVSMVLVCYAVFRSSRLLWLYVSYELSLIPIILIIIIWGSYPERSLSSLMLLLYTSIFTIPFLFVLFYVFSSSNTFSFAFLSAELSPFITLIVFCVFAVKLPIYGLHFWLPMAHVEAPTFGSMILAGVLLKLGGVGLLRCYLIVDWSFVSYFTLSYFFVFLVYVTLVCSFQSDFKRLVAYSSVSHMIVVPILLIRFTFIGFKGLVLVLLFHGFSSPLLFSLVGYIYSMYGTRLVVAIRGLVLCSPLVSTFSVLAFMFSLCVPPFPSYVSEVMFFVSSISLWSLAPILLVVFSFLSLIYNLNWLSSVVFSSPSPSVSYSAFHFTYFYFFSMVVFLLLGFVFIFLFPYI